MIPWEFIKETANGMKLYPGETFETTLLGQVPYWINNGVAEGIVDPSLQRIAMNHGFVIEAAFPRESKYLLRVISPMRS